MPRGLVSLTIVAVMVLGGLIGVQPAASAWAQTSNPDLSTKLHFRLSELLTRELPLPPQDKGLMRIDGQGRVQVYIKAEPATQERRELYPA